VVETLAVNVGRSVVTPSLAVVVSSNERVLVVLAVS
jgi:hypothetical protein